MHTKSELLSLLRARGLRLKKSLGQHYLIDPAMGRRLVDLCALTSQDLVVEIGAGLGAITDVLAERAARVVAIERDRTIAELLVARLASYPNVEILCRDALEVSWAPWKGCTVVGLIPYLITSPLLVRLCEEVSQVHAVWLGVQQEVADRLTARAGTKAYGRLSILVQYRWQVAQRAKIPRRVFFPQPAVDSAWVELAARRAPAVRVDDETLFFELVRTAFSQRRKTLVNCLLGWRDLSREQIQACLRTVELPASVRGEAVSLEGFAALANHLQAVR